MICLVFLESWLTMAIRWTSSGARLPLAIAAMLICIGLTGCGQSGRTVPAPTDVTLLRGIIRVYATAANELGRPPQKMDELRAILAPVDKDTDKYLRSKRDGEEFVVVWGQDLDHLPGDTIVAYERKGIDG
jgi:hypothetical protein